MLDDVTLGCTYRDRVSGFEGIAIARHEYYNGCLRITLGGQVHEGKVDDLSFDVQQLEYVDSGLVEEHVAAAKRATGGPRGTTPPARTGH
jgi:hypothetical protein